MSLADFVFATNNTQKMSLADFVFATKIQQGSQIF